MYEYELQIFATKKNIKNFVAIFCTETSSVISLGKYSLKIKNNALPKINNIVVILTHILG